MNDETRRLGRALGYGVVGGAAAGELLWIVAAFSSPLLWFAFAPIAMTVGAVLGIMFSFLSVAAMGLAWPWLRHSRRRARIVAAVVSGLPLPIYFVVIGGGSGQSWEIAGPVAVVGALAGGLLGARVAFGKLQV